MGFHTFQIEHNGAMYGAVVQRESSQPIYRIMYIRDLTRQHDLPVFDIEKEYVRREGSLMATTLRSRWAARRRARQYIRLWNEQGQTETE
jgi:hypothetical protein